MERCEITPKTRPGAARMVAGSEGPTSSGVTPRGTRSSWRVRGSWRIASRVRVPSMRSTRGSALTALVLLALALSTLGLPALTLSARTTARVLRKVLRLRSECDLRKWRMDGLRGSVKSLGTHARDVQEASVHRVVHIIVPTSSHTCTQSYPQEHVDTRCLAPHGDADRQLPLTCRFVEKGRPGETKVPYTR